MTATRHRAADRIDVDVETLRAVVMEALRAVMADRYLTVADLADRLGVSVNAVYGMNKRGTGPKRFKPGGGGGPVRYSLAAVEAWERENTR